MEGAQRTARPGNISWRITVKPHVTGDVTGDVSIETGDGRKPANSVGFTVSGPGRQGKKGGKHVWTAEGGGRSRWNRIARVRNRARNPEPGTRNPEAARKGEGGIPMGLDRPMDAPATAETAGRHGPSRGTATWNVRPPSPGFLDPAGRGQVMATARRLAPLPLLMALLALGVALLWLTPAQAQVTTRILVSNLDQGDGNAETTNGNDHAQLFHTGGATIGYLLTSVIVSSVDPQGDDFDVEVCLANNDTGFPTSTCTELNPPNSYASGDLTFTAPGDGMRLQRNDNYSVVIKQKGTGSVILDSTTSGGEDSTGLSGWSIRNKFDWKDSGTWKQASSDEAIRIEIRGHEAQNQAATGLPVVLVSAEGPGILAADTWRIADADGLPYTDNKGSVDPPGSGGPDNGEFVFDFSYQWIRVDADTGTDTNIGTDSPRYQLVDADFGKKIKVRVSFTDRFNSPEAVTSVPFGPVVRPAPLPSPSTLVGNTGQSPSDVATIRQLYAMGFRLGNHGQGYEISSVSIDLAAAPADLKVSLWTGGPPGGSYAGTRTAKLFEFENPASFQAGLNEFTAPAGVHAHQNVNYWIVLSDFGSSLSINETSSDAEDAGGEPGAVICNFSGNEYVVNEGDVNEMQVSCNDNPGDSSVLRLAVKGSPRTSGILAANFAQSGGGGTTQEIISVGDKVGFGIDLGAADRYLVRGLTLNGDDTTSNDGGFDNPFYFRSDSLSGDRHFNLFQTRNVNGLPVWTAPQGAAVAGRKTYVFHWSFSDDRKNGSDTIDRIGAVLHRVQAVADDADGRSDAPTAPGVSLRPGRDVSGIDNEHNTAYMAVHGEPLYAVVQNLGQADNGYVSVGTTNTVVSQGFTTGSLEDGYPLLGFGVNIEDSAGNLPGSSASVAVALHSADADGKPDEKLFDLLSPTEYAAGHSFFEAPRATTLDPGTSYVLVWRHVSGASHRLQKTSSNGEDSGAYAGFSMADAFHRGADLGNLAADSNGNALEIAVYARVENQPATGRPEVYPSADGAGILLADTFGIEDPNGVLVYNPKDEDYVRSYDWDYQWIRVDGETGAETEVGADSARYQPAVADTGHRIKVRVSFTDQAGYPEAVTSRPFGPIAAAGPSTSYPSTLVSNTGRSSSATANITQQYAMGFRLGAHGQGYEISSVSLELAAAPSDLTVSLWIDALPGYELGGDAAYKMFDFENPSSLQAGENRFTAPAGAFAYQNMNYFIVLSGFGSSLSIRETTANAEDPGGETGAVLFNDARVRALGATGRWTSSSTRAGVLRLAVEGWRRDSGFLASNYGQVQDHQEIISKGDNGGMPITLGAADRYIIRGFSWLTDDSTPDFGGIHNPFDLRSGWTLHGDGKINSAGTKHFGLIPTRYETPGINVWTAPQGATVPGNAQYMVYEKYESRPVGPVLTRFFATSSNKDDPPTAPGVTLSDAIGDLDGRPLMAFLGEPLEAMVQNLGQTNSGYASVGGDNARVLSQGFTTGSDGFGYRLQGVGVNIEGSGGRIPDDASSVSVAVHADSGGQPGDKLFDLVSPTNYAAGHSFFEAPAGTYLDPSTGYVLVWTYNQGAWHRLRRTSSNGEDAGALTGASAADAYYLGADLGSLAVHSGGNALEFAVYTEVLDTEPIRPGEFVIQSPTRALVSNIGQTSESNGYEADTGIRYAPSFNTGPEAVTLDSVELDVETAPATTSDVSVAIHRDASGDPGSKLYDLANPATIGTGVQKFTAPAAARLDADTTYYVVISSSGSTIKMSFTNSDNEDAGGADGWTIDDDMHFNRGSWDTDRSVIQIRVNGHFSRTVTPTEVPFGWPLAPDALGDEGGQFRLLFLTSTESAATSTDIETYNSFVQAAAAAGHDAIQDYSEGFRAVASTAAVAARDNTYTTGTSVPIYWLGGNKLANSYRDFYDGRWDDEENPTDESGAAIAIGSAWTGSGPDGTKGVHDTHGATVLGGGARAQAAFGRLDSATAGPLSGGHGWREIERSLYAVSEVFTVGPNPARITDLAITSDPGADRIYRTGDEIKVTATFGAPVTVVGQPRVKLRLGQGEDSDRWAEAEGETVETVDVVDLVKNTGQTSTAIVTEGLNITFIKRAQAFTTGAEANGYMLSSIGIKFFKIAQTSTAGSHLTATLNADDNGNPGAALCTLVDPPSFTGSGVQTFDASEGCPTLAASTTYYVVIERVVLDSTQRIQLSLVANDNHNEDSGGAAGWSVGNGRHSLESGESWASVPSDPYQIEVRGAANPPPPPAELQVSNAGQALDSRGMLSAAGEKAGQAFTTGPNPAGYVLGSLSLDIYSWDTASDLTVTLNADDNGVPGDALCTLSAPASLTRPQTLGAPAACPTLTPRTTYFAVVEAVVATTPEAALGHTASYDEDGGSAPGWTIANYSVYFGTQWDPISTDIYFLEVSAATVPTVQQLAVAFTYLVQAGDESDTDGVAVGVAGEENNEIDLNEGEINFAGTSRGAVLGFSPVPSDDGHLVNWARPTLAGAATSTGGRRLFLTFNEELNPDGSPPTSSFAVTVDGGAAPLQGTTASVAGRVVALRLATPLDSATRTLRVSYTDPSAGDDTAAVEDRQGNDAASFRGRAVTNRFGAVNRVFPDFALVPAGLGVGDSFRLLFLTSTLRDATATDIETYNAFVQAAAAAGHADIQDYRASFFAVASTADDDARDNTGTPYTSSNQGVPIYWLAGNQVADDYADFYDGDWADEENATDESGSANALNGAWTGSDLHGTEAFDGSRSLALGGDATETAGIGLLNSVDSGIGPLAGPKKKRDSERPLYGLSEVFTVVDPASITDVAIVSDRGAGGNYLTGDEVEVAVTFGRPVEIEGNPRIRLRLAESGESVRWAEYERDALVKNTGQPQFSGTALTAARPRLAQRFRTGGGVYVYELSAIGIKFHTIANPGTAGDQLTVTLNADDNGSPAATPLCTLGDPADFGATGLQTFDAPEAPDACPDLAGETDYYVVVERVSFSAADTIAVWHTASAREDAGVASGWSIGDRGHTDTGHMGTSSWSDGGPPFLIKVMGDLPVEFQDRVLISNTGQPIFGRSIMTGAEQFRINGKFKVGSSSRGYRLSSIGFAMSTISDASAVRDLFRVTLNADQGYPGYELCTLSPPASFRANAVNRYNAPASCPLLAPGTDYHVVVELLDFGHGETIGWTNTRSRTYDAGVAAGWRFAQLIFGYGSGGNFPVGLWDLVEDGTVFRFEVSGRALLSNEQAEPPEPPRQTRKQVANTGQTGLVGSALTRARTKHAQAFTTGANASGYWMDAVRVGFGTVTDPRSATADVRVRLHEGGGADPGALLCTMFDPSDLNANSVSEFDYYGNCPTLTPNTSYFVVVERTAFTTGTIETSAYTSDGEDAARPGWSIADDSRVFGTAWASGGGASMAIDVRAVDLPPEEPQNLGPVSDLVSNTGQTLDLVEDLRGNLTKVAQKFTAGDNPGGYRLSSIGIHFKDVVNSPVETAISAMAVTLNPEANGEPGDALCTLIDPAAFTDNAVLTFAAPTSGTEACPTLAGGGTYFVVVEQDTNTAVVIISATSSADEDAGSAPGWSIADSVYAFNSSTSVWFETTGSSYPIKISGAAVLSDPSGPEAAPQPRRFIYTVAADDESTVRGVAVGGSGSTDDLDLNGGEITVVATGAEAPLDFPPLPQDGDHLVNWARPALVQAVTSRDGSLVRLTFSEELETGGQVPSARFTVEVDDVAVELTGIDVEESISVGADQPSVVDTWSVDAPREAPADWALTPAGLSAGDEFRLLFLTSTTRDATSSDIDDYNTFVQTAARAGHTAIQGYSDGFYAVASTADDDARDNTETTYTASDKGVPIYWLGGNQLADDYEDFYDGTWDEEANTTDESGNPRPVPTLADYPWTGSKHDGTEVMEHGNSLTLGSAGSHSVVGSPNAGDSTDGPLNSLAVPYAGLRPLYALSLPFVVAAAVEPQVLGSAVTLELVTPLSSPDQEVTVSYADPSRNDDTGVVEDLVGNDADSFTDRPVINRVAFAPPSVEVPADWALVPEGLPAGAEFRLLFLPAGGRDATSSVINDYDDFVQSAAAGGHGAIREYADGFFAVASTPDTDARDNTATTYTAGNRGVPIYWLGSAQVADNYADFYDGSWDDEVNATDQSGARRRVSASADYPWTGSDHDGTEKTERGRSLALGGSGAVAVGAPNVAEPGIGPLDGGDAPPAGLRPLYALSQVFVVEPLPVPAGSPIVPEGLTDGDRFRLLFLSSGAREATSSDIADYNDFIQAAAADGHSGVQAFSDGFQAVASTAQVDARENTWTRDRGRADLLAGRRQAGRRLRRLLRRDLGRGGRRHRRVGRRARRHGGRRPGLDGQRPRRHAGL